MQKSLGRRLAAPTTALRAAVPVALGALLLVIPAAADAARVTVRVEGATKTLVPATTITTPAKPVGLPGKPTCPGATGLGALDAATHGNWSGTYSQGFMGYLVDTITGEKHGGSPDFYSFWTNLREASVGVCGYHPRDGAQILFFVSRFPSKKPIEPLELRAPKTVRAGRTFTVVVRKWSAKGVPSRVAGATVSLGRSRLRTNRQGFVRITVGERRASGSAGPLRLRATAPGLVRSETDTVRVLRQGDVSR